MPGPAGSAACDSSCSVGMGWTIAPGAPGATITGPSVIGSTRGSGVVCVIGSLVIMGLTSVVLPGAARAASPAHSDSCTPERELQIAGQLPLRGIGEDAVHGP